MADITITTTDINRDYEIIGPVYFQVSNKGFFTSKMSKLIKKYKQELKNDPAPSHWNKVYGAYAFDSESRLDKAFYIGVKELEKQAEILGADAVIGMRQDVDMDTQGFQFFYMQMHGTAVKFK